MSDPRPTETPVPESATESATEALQVVLAAEHAAVFVLGALGGQTSQSASPALYSAVTAAYGVHLTRRDELVAMLTDAGAEPTPAAPGYQLPAELGSPGAVSARALQLEQAAAETYAYLVASTTGETRAWGVQALLDAAVRGLGFGGRPEQLPGL